MIVFSIQDKPDLKKNPYHTIRLLKYKMPVSRNCCRYYESRYAKISNINNSYYPRSLSENWAQACRLIFLNRSRPEEEAIYDIDDDE